MTNRVRAVLARSCTLVGVVDIERSGARSFTRMAAELRHVAASDSLIAVPTIRWTVLEDGIVEAHVEPEDGVLDRALNDSITSRAPVGAVHAGLSTYWVDSTESNLRSAQRGGIADPIASGNVTYLRLHGSVVVAGYDFDPEEVEAASMPVEEFLALLFEWRTRIIEAGGASGADAAKLVDERPRYPLGPAKWRSGWAERPTLHDLRALGRSNVPIRNGLLVKRISLISSGLACDEPTAGCACSAHRAVLTC